jgi:hypothetical protein
MKRESYHEETYRGCKIRLDKDDSPESPRDWDNLGVMLTWHRRYNLGDEQPKCSAEDWFLKYAKESAWWQIELDKRQAEVRSNNPDVGEDELDDLLDGVAESMDDDTELHQAIFDRDNVRLPLYLYDHSGITISTSQFSCAWDSGQIGFIYCNLNKARKEWSLTANATWETIVTPDTQPRMLQQVIHDRLIGEVETYDAFITGNVVSFIAEDPEGETIDSCCGFYPDSGDYAKRWDYPIGEAKSAIDRWHEDQDKEKSESAYWAARDVETV